jgi:hypothetical protein
MAFDLGLNKDSTEKEVDELIARLDTWTLVMLTEYMDHSLVLLKRKMCGARFRTETLCYL